MEKSIKSKEKNIVGNGVTRRVKRKRICPRDSTGTYSAVQGPSRPAKSTNTVSLVPPAATSTSTLPAYQRVTHSFAPELASSQAAFTPNTTSEALLTQQDLARSDERHDHQHSPRRYLTESSCSCMLLYMYSHILMYTNTFHMHC